ncbi:MAG TPA: MBL fold metallo-hydrolase, partial [Candidatus Methanoperedens sp.]|nr:MBL fold metallo-hydrolase [Candidatus Methanoperedens sp.]
MQVIKINNSPDDANAYLVNGTILIDVGMDCNDIIPELGKHIDLHDLELIILTHCHYDHSGGAGGVAAATGARIAVHKNDAPLLLNPDASASRLFG